MDGAGLPRRAGSGADPRPRGPEHGRRAGAGPDHRRDGVQPVEHHRRVPPARQPEPGPQGGLRRRLGAAARLPMADPAAGAERGARRGHPRDVRAHQPVRAVVPAPGPPRACSTSRPSGTSCGRGTCSTASSGRPRQAARPVPPDPTRRAGPGRPGRSTGPATTCPRPRWARWDRPSAVTCGRIYRPDLFDEPNPITVSQQLLHREHVPAGPLAEPARRGVDPVPGARLGRSRPLPARARPTSGLPLPPGMTWSNTPGGPLEHEMRIAGNIPFPAIRGPTG